MKTVLIALLLLTVPLAASDRQLTLAREMLEDAILRNDEEGMRLTRERLLRLIAETTDAATLRDAHYLVALSAQFERYSGFRDASASAALLATGARHAERALELDERFAAAWIFTNRPNRIARALELDANAPAVAFFHGMFRSFNPAGPAPPESVSMFEQLVARLDTDRNATGRRFGLWDAYAHAWLLFVKMAVDEPDPAALRPAIARLLARRPDFAIAQQIDDSLRERRFVAAPNVEWQRILTDAAGDGATPTRPDVVAVDRGESEDRLWYRVAFHGPLPRSFGVNLIFDRDGDPSTGMPWWGNGSKFRFDRLVSVWITRDGDRYSGTTGVTDDDAARSGRLAKITTDVIVAMDGDRRVILGVPRASLALTDSSTVIAAGGTHLAWNDDATSASNSR